jgi:hypothetical protein
VFFYVLLRKKVCKYSNITYHCSVKHIHDTNMIIKYTQKVNQMSKREKETIFRFQNYHRCSAILSGFFAMGFTSFEALKGIMVFYYPGIDLVKLKRFWNCVLMDAEIAAKVAIVFDKLKSE